MIAKSRELRADQVILDLEDSVAAEMKDVARDAALGELKRGGWGDRVVSVRVNAPETHAGRLDLEAMSGAEVDIDTVVIPKVESPDDVRAVLGGLGTLASSIGVEALIETAAGLDNVRAIAACDDAVEALVFGPLDMGASLGIQAFGVEASAGYPEDLWNYVRFAILVAARAVGTFAIDGPFPQIDDLKGLRASASAAAAAGYDGKWVIHPSQIDPVNQAFSPTREAFDEARRIVDALDRVAGEHGRGAVEVDGLMIDKASRRMAEGILARGRAAGLG